MKTALLATLIPLGYIVCGLFTARGVLAFFVKPDGTYNRRDEAHLKAVSLAVFWPLFTPWYGIYWSCKKLYAMGWGVNWILDPKPVRERKAREKKYAEAHAKFRAESAATLAREQARYLARQNELPWPQMNPFLDDTGTLQYNPVGRPPMSEGK